jgi:hypothetical protein
VLNPNENGKISSLSTEVRFGDFCHILGNKFGDLRQIKQNKFGDYRRIT